MKKAIIASGVFLALLLGGCSSDESVASEADKQEDETKLEEKESQREGKDDSETSSVDEDEQEGRGDPEESGMDSHLVSYEDFSKPSVEYIKDIAPNDLAKEIENNPYDFPVVDEENQDDFNQRFDIDQDGEEEEIKILTDGTYSGEYPSYILAIYDSKGNPKYAEYQYNAESLEDAMPFLTVSELTGDNFLEIVMDSTGGYGFMEGNGFQSVGRLVYGFDSDMGNFRLLPVLGSYYDIYWEENLTVQVDERVSGFAESYDYIEELGSEAEVMMKHAGIIGDDYNHQVGKRFVGESRRVYPEKAMKENETDEQFNLVSHSIIHEMNEATLASKDVYRWNDIYGWFEVVNSNLTLEDDDTYTFEKSLYDPSSFNKRFKTDETDSDEYMGEWQMVIDGKLQQRYLDIGPERILETERSIKDYEQLIEREIEIDNYVYKEETGQLMPVGEMLPFLDQPYNKSYQNLFTLLDIGGEQMLMDQYGHLYVKGGGQRETSDEYKWEGEASSEVEPEEIEVLNTKIDVLSTRFINDYFSGPEPFTFKGIEEGMSQSEVEGILGTPEDYYPVEGAEFAVYDNVAILYSENFPSRADAFQDINPDQNYVTRTDVLLRVPHDQVVAAYGEPTLDYDEYPDIGPGARRMIYDQTKNNGYAVYIEVGLSGTTWLMTKDEEIDIESLKQ